MRLFECQACGHWLSFEDVRCAGCGRQAGFLHQEGRMRSFDASGEGLVTPFGNTDAVYRFCANANHDACNWLVEESSPESLCACCRTNLMIPDISIEVQAARWRQIEQAKHRLFYSLLRLRLPIPNKADEPVTGLSFQFLADSGDTRVMTGHEDGLITINIVEADDAERERARAEMQEPYRTLLGHFRHEVGHYYWDRQVRDGGLLDEFRSLFGDESVDYGTSLQRYYAGDFPHDWPERYVTQYASSHPWEDFAETFAHYLHMIDTLETAYAFGVHIHPKQKTQPSLDTDVDFDPYRNIDFDSVLDTWSPLTFAVNSLNRSMGQPDLYPFVLVPGVADKLRFIDRLAKGKMLTRQAA